MCFEREANTKQQRQLWDCIIKPSHERKNSSTYQQFEGVFSIEGRVAIRVMYSTSTKLCLLVDKYSHVVVFFVLLKMKITWTEFDKT